MPGLPASVDLDECISRLYKKELLAESVIEAICAKTKELLMRESNVVHVRAPVTVVGDIHGQFFDLIEIFKIGGWCPDTNYLFLGMHAPGPDCESNKKQLLYPQNLSALSPSVCVCTLLTSCDHREQATMLTAACSASKPFPFLSV